MDKQEFINNLKKAMQYSKDISEETILNSIAEWDSIAVMSVVSMFAEKYSVTTNYSEIAAMKTVSDLINKVSNK